MTTESRSSTINGLLYAEDLIERIGLRIALGPASLTESEIRAFAQQWDPLPMHVGDGGTFGSVIASGLHTFATFQRLAVDAEYSSWAIVAGRKSHMVLPRPVFPGDILTGWLAINGAAPPRKGRVKLSLEGHLENQDGEQVFSLLMDSYVQCRPKD